VRNDAADGVVNRPGVLIVQLREANVMPLPT